ncbi:MAG: hypothetical protein H7X99_11345, partial [Saprospiraceae bacterium]|nr:hypothetical protein [Saprospiraceae bacterium]
NLGNSNQTYHVVLLSYSTFWNDTNDKTILDGFKIESGNANGNSEINVNNETISRNNGGGVFVSSSKYQLDHNTLMNNTAGNGGGLFAQNSDGQYNNNTITGNVATLGMGICTTNCISIFDSDNFIRGAVFQNGNAIFTGENIILE